VKYLVRSYHPGWKFWQKPEVLLLPYHPRKEVRGERIHLAKDGEVLVIAANRVERVTPSQDTFDLERDSYATGHL
jgi:hypothetical protein